jgi:hypothetical protein
VRQTRKYFLLYRNLDLGMAGRLTLRRSVLPNTVQERFRPKIILPYR